MLTIAGRPSDIRYEVQSRQHSASRVADFRLQDHSDVQTVRRNFLRRSEMIASSADAHACRVPTRYVLCRTTSSISNIRRFELGRTKRAWNRHTHELQSNELIGVQDVVARGDPRS